MSFNVWLGLGSYVHLHLNGPFSDSAICGVDILTRYDEKRSGESSRSTLKNTYDVMSSLVKLHDQNFSGTAKTSVDQLI